MKTRIASMLLPKTQDILFLAIFVAVLALGQRMINLDGDLPRHLLTGKFILQTRTIPSIEPFVYPYEGRPYVSHEWLADIGFYLTYNLLGLAGIVILAATLLASTFTALYSRVSSRLDTRLPVLALFVWGATATSLNWATRPHLISMLLLAVWLIWTDKLSRGEKVPLWAFFISMMVWSNLHGEFIAGMLVMLAYTVGWTMEFLLNRTGTDVKTGQRLWLGLSASALASLLNPAGIRPWLTMLGFVNNRYLMSRMYEARPPDFSRPEFLVLLGLLIVSMILLANHPKRLTAGQAFLLAGFSAMSLLAARNIHLYGVVAPFALAETVAGFGKTKILRTVESTLKHIERQLKSTLWPIATVVVSCVIIFAGQPGKTYSFSSSIFPTDAIKWLESHPQDGRMFNDLNWGGYIAFHLWPEQKIFADSMADVTGELTRQYEMVITLTEGWKDVFSKYQIEWVIIPTNSELSQALGGSSAWETLYADSTATILRRITP